MAERGCDRAGAIWGYRDARSLTAGESEAVFGGELEVHCAGIATYRQPEPVLRASPPAPELTAACATDRARTMMGIQKGWTVALILAGAVGFVACGSDDDDGPGGTGGSAGATGGTGGSTGGTGGATGGTGGSTGGAGGATGGAGGATGGAGGATGGAGGATGGAGGATGGSAGVDGGSDASAGTGGFLDAGTDGSAGTVGTVDAGSDGSAGSGGADAGADGGLAFNNLVLFHAGQQQSDLKGRKGADTLCATALTSEAKLAGATSHAFISVSATDEIRDMPTLYSLPTNRPIVDVNGKKIADDWADLLDGSIDVALDETAVLGAAGNNDSFWHSGSNADGSLHPDNCTGWTTTSTGVKQMAGRHKTTNSAWISWSAALGCSGQFRLLCIAWK